MSISIRRVFYVLLMAFFVFWGTAFWLNTVVQEKQKTQSSEIIAASNAYFLYKKSPSSELANSVLRHQATVTGRNYAILVLRDFKAFNQVGNIYLGTMITQNNREIFETFVYGVDLELYYRKRLSGEKETDSPVLSGLKKGDLEALYSCYSALRNRYSYPWSESLVPYFGRPLENFDSFFDVKSKACNVR